MLMLSFSMSEEIKSDSTSATSTPTQEATSPVSEGSSSQNLLFGVPMDVVVRGGTTSYAHDQLMAKQRAEDEARREEADEDKRLAARGDRPGDVAKMHTMNLGTPSQSPVVLLTFVSPKGEVKMDKSKPMQMLADVFVGENMDDPTDLTLNMVCPYCVERGTPQGRAQFKVRQSHRPWHLDVKSQGEFFRFEGGVYRSAGTIMDSSRLKCPNCNWTFRIDKNNVREDV